MREKSTSSEGDPVIERDCEELLMELEPPSDAEYAEPER
jgi:hypothetical protein